MYVLFTALFTVPSPNIALVTSGGSERAMVGLLGSLDALSQDDLLDFVLYLAGLSGLTW